MSNTITAEAVSNVVRFPISPEYCGDWDATRAIGEIIANALDEDSATSVVYADGEIVIEDSGPGIPRKALVIGVSLDNRTGGRKSDDQIGRFGEGLNVGALVLAREGVPMFVETVGYSFRPAIAFDDHLGTDLLELHYSDSARTSGTRVTIECDQQTATKSIGRFLALSQPGYTPPAAPGRVILEGSGCLYIGGVFIQQHPNLAFGYDIALSEVNKGMQNRDRSVVDSAGLESAIGDILRSETDRDVLAVWLERALEGKLGSLEDRAVGKSPEQRIVLREIFDETRDGDKVFWVRSGNEEHAMDLRDRGYTVIEQKLDAGAHGHLMAALAIEESQAKVNSSRREYSEKKKKSKSFTEWTPEESITDRERRVLNLTILIAYTAWGKDAVGEVKVFDKHVWETGFANAIGIYFSDSHTVSIKHSLLDQGVLEVLDTLSHEVAHRVAHRSGYDGWEDRTRGHMDAMTGMAAALAAVLARALAALGDPSREIGPDLSELVDEFDASLLYARADCGDPITPVAVGSLSTQTPTKMAVELFRDQMAVKGVKTYTDLAYRAGSDKYRIGQLLLGNESSRPHVMNTVYAFLGLDPDVMHLAFFAERMATSPRQKNGRLRADQYSAITPIYERALAVHPEIVVQIGAHLDGTDRSLPFAWTRATKTYGNIPATKTHYGRTYQVNEWHAVGPSEPYLDVYRTLIRAERERVAANVGDPT